ncbi:MAG TPA: DUF1648 domain-containing protein [Pyrinomonadaceae bacterium]|jgi:uncharacterized membrane protein
MTKPVEYTPRRPISHSEQTAPRRPDRRINLPFELLVAVMTVAPILVLVYFYTALPDRVPMFLNLHGDVIAWARKGLISVFHLPAMGIVLQVLCLLMKYSPLQARVNPPTEKTEDFLSYLDQTLKAHMRLWDWMRLMVAFKWIGASLVVIFLSFERLRPLATGYTIISLLATAIAIVCVLFYGHRLLLIKRRMKAEFGSSHLQTRVDAAHLYGGIFYYNPADPSLFVGRHVLNLGNRWSYAFIACFVAYPLLVFLPSIVE